MRYGACNVSSGRCVFNCRNGKCIGKTELEGPGRRWKNYIKIQVREISHENVNFN